MGTVRPARRLVTLIGMPTAGKTKMGRIMAGHLQCGFVDIDDRIVEEYGVERLQDLVDRLSPAEFAAAEQKVAMRTVAELSAPTIIATGGSVIYLDDLMAYLDRETHIVHLCASLETLERRIAKRPDRGIVYAPGETLADLYRRRTPLYEKWAHRTVETDRGRTRAARRLAAQLLEEGIVAKGPRR